ncbi:MAG: hypothetical protein OEY14_14030, partial [Myxococcales bacterium]|nr:hypothetical protein [Myxococcales bacterium]
VSTAPWHDADATERLIAIVGPQHFIVSRPEDLARVLALATARADRDSDEEGLETTLASEALLALGPGEAFRFEAEGARRFAPRAEPHQIPERMRLAIREFPDGRVRIEGAAFFDDAAQAGEGREFWQGQIAAQGTMLTLLGFGSALQALRLELRGRRIILETELTQRQAQLAIGLLQGLMQGWVRDMERRRAERTRRAQDAPPP